jgi:hypothetical protein
MRRLLILSFAVMAITFSGCQSQQARIDDAQKDYDAKAKKFQEDCSSELLTVPPKISPKCQEEDRVQAEAWKRLQTERSKK